jgi:hypothetical protein
MEKENMAAVLCGRERGQALIIGILAMTALLGSVALAIDGGHAYAVQRSLQNSVDAMALAGADAHGNEGYWQAVQAAIYEYGQINGVDACDTAWSYVHEGEEHVGVVVTGTMTFPTFFGGVIGVNSVTTSASATAEIGQRLGTCRSGISVGDGTLEIKGEGHTIIGDLQSNGDMHLSADALTISGTVSYAGTCSGDLCPPEPSAPEDWPDPYHIADYRPGGDAAVTAGVDYHYAEGNLDFPCSSAYGLYYATGHVTVDCEAITGTVTIVSEGKVTLKGQDADLVPYSEGLLFFSNIDGEAIDLTGQTHTLEGVLYAPNGQVKIQAQDLAITGSVIGESARFTGGSEGATLVFTCYLPPRAFLAW